MKNTKMQNVQIIRVLIHIYTYAIFAFANLLLCDFLPVSELISCSYTNPLISGAAGVPEYAMTASSNFGMGCCGSDARINSDFPWQPSYNAPGEWIQVAFQLINGSLQLFVERL